MLARHQFGGLDSGETLGDNQFRASELPADAGSGKGIFSILWSRKILLLLFTAIALGTMQLYLRRLTPEYSSTARVCVEESVTHFMGNSFAAQISPQYLATQAEIMKSTRVLQLTESKLKALRTSDGKPEILRTFAGSPHFVGTLQANLSVLIDPKANIIEISFVSRYPEEAAEIVNVMVAAYQELHAADELHDSAEVLTATQSEKTKREAELAEGLNKLNQVRRDLANLESPEALASRMNQLSTLHAQAQVKVAEAQSSLGANNPGIQTAIENERRLAGVLAQARVEAAHADAAREVLLQSQQDVNRLRDQADQADKLVKEAAAAVVNHSGPAHLIVFEEGRPDWTPVRPRKLQLLGLAAVLGLILGGATALLLERLDQRISSPLDFVAILRVPILGNVPLMTGRPDHGIRGRHVYLNPMSVVSEAYRAIWKAICFGVPRGAGSTVLITSPSPGDGKSTTAANLAIAMHQSGERVLIIDGDLRRPIQHITFGLLNKVGFSSVLSGHCPARNAIQRSSVKGLDVLTSGPVPSNPAEVLRRGAFARLLEELAGEYDRVVIDSPPVTTASDTLTLAALCDLTVLVLRAEKSTKNLTAAARDCLMSVGANLLGVVVNGSNTRRSSYYAYTGRSQNATVRVSSRDSDAHSSLVEDHDGNGHSDANGNTAKTSELVVASSLKPLSESPARPYRAPMDRETF